MKQVASGIFAGVMLLCLTACGKGKDNNPDTSSSDSTGTSAVIETDVSGRKVGISLPSSEVPRWTWDGEYLKQALEAQGVEVVLVYADEIPAEATEDAAGTEIREGSESSLSGNPEGGDGTAAEETGEGNSVQADNVSELIRANCDVLVIAPDEKGSLAGVLEEAKEKGIPVISYDGLIRGTDAVQYYVSFDSYRIGQLQGEALAAALGLGSSDHSDKKLRHIEFVAGDPGDYRSGYLFNGAYDILKTYLDAGSLSVPSGQVTFAAVTTPDWSSDNVKARLDEILKTYYRGDLQLDGVLCPNDSTALGAIESVRSAYGGKHKVIVTGWGADEGGLAAVVDGEQAMTVFGNSDYESDITCSLICSLLRGDAADANLIKDGAFAFSCRYDTASYDNGTGIIPSFLIEPDVITAGSTDLLTNTGKYTMEGKYPVYALNR